MESQFGLANVWTQGDFVTRCGRAAAGDVAGLVDRHHHQGAGHPPLQEVRARSAELLAQRRLRRRPEQARHRPDATRSARWRSKAAKPPPHHRNTKAQLHDTLDVSDWVTRCLRNCIDEFTARLQIGPGHSGFGRLHGALHRPVRHGLGHLPRAAGHRHGRPGDHRQGGRPDRRGADHDGAGPGRGDSRRARLQRAGARQQVRADQAQQLRARPARLLRHRRARLSSGEPATRACR